MGLPPQTSVTAAFPTFPTSLLPYPSPLPPPLVVSPQPFEFMVGAQYKAMEVAKGDWAAVRRGPPHAIDAWGLGKRTHSVRGWVDAC